LFLKTKLLIRSFFQSRLLSRKVHVYETIVSFIEDARRDQGEWGKSKNLAMQETTLKLNKMIIGYMPQDIHQIYLEETEVFKSNLNQLISEGKQKNKKVPQVTSSENKINEYMDTLESMQLEKSPNLLSGFGAQ
jgi:hypothetical protein